MKKKLCPHPIPEESTSQVLENLVESFISPGKNGYTFETKEQFLETLTSFYNCPVCARQRKLNESQDLELLVTLTSKDKGVNLRHNWKNNNLQVYPPYYMSLQSGQHSILDLGFTLDIPQHYVLQFNPADWYTLQGLIIQSPSLFYMSNKSCFVSLYNPSDKVVEVSREAALGFYVPIVLPKIKLRGMKS